MGLEAMPQLAEVETYWSKTVPVGLGGVGGVGGGVRDGDASHG